MLGTLASVLAPDLRSQFARNLISNHSATENRTVFCARNTPAASSWAGCIGRQLTVRQFISGHMPRAASERLVAPLSQ